MKIEVVNPENYNLDIKYTESYGIGDINLIFAKISSSNKITLWETFTRCTEFFTDMLLVSLYNKEYDENIYFYHISNRFLESGDKIVIGIKYVSINSFRQILDTVKQINQLENNLNFRQNTKIIYQAKKDRTLFIQPADRWTKFTVEFSLFLFLLKMYTIEPKFIPKEDECLFFKHVEKQNIDPNVPYNLIIRANSIQKRQKVVLDYIRTGDEEYENYIKQRFIESQKLPHSNCGIISYISYREK